MVREKNMNIIQIIMKLYMKENLKIIQGIGLERNIIMKIK